MARTLTRGTCGLCGGAFGKRAMTTHLAACRQRNPQPLSARGKEQTVRLLHLVVDGRYTPEYWLHLEAPANATLKTLDGFLRKTWLECCGHLSAFTIGSTSYSVMPQPGERGMGMALEKTLSVGAEFRHEYDFGSTTELRLKVVSERQGLTRDQDVHILARNEPPAIVCGECEKPATTMCTECLDEGEGWVCDGCAAHHDEDMLLPVVNSPRVGVCAYGG